MSDAMGSQLSLFMPEDMFSQLRVSEHELSFWFETGFLSFNPRAVSQFEPWMKREAVFVRDLMRTEMSLNTVRAMLSKLERPYAYKHGDIFFDFAQQQWQRRWDPQALAMTLAANPQLAQAAVVRLLGGLARFGYRSELKGIEARLLELLARGEADAASD